MINAAKPKRSANTSQNGTPKKRRSDDVSDVSSVDANEIASKNDQAGDAEKKERKVRRRWTLDEEDAIVRAYKKWGHSWVSMLADPEFSKTVRIRNRLHINTCILICIACMHVCKCLMLAFFPDYLCFRHSFEGERTSTSKTKYGRCKAQEGFRSRRDRYAYMYI
jgi:hypothetical protein